MANALAGKVVFAAGSGTPEHRALAVALAESGADVAVAGPPGMPYEVLMNSISNEIWALGRRSTVIAFERGDTRAFADAVQKAQSELGRVDFVVNVEPVLNA
jgi:NAD(P)-dependent dehydrogenase (short-subunit alcohol dehydrogenase family)